MNQSFLQTFVSYDKGFYPDGSCMGRIEIEGLR